MLKILLRTLYRQNLIIMGLGALWMVIFSSISFSKTSMSTWPVSSLSFSFTPRSIWNTDDSRFFSLRLNVLPKISNYLLILQFLFPFFFSGLLQIYQNVSMINFTRFTYILHLPCAYNLSFFGCWRTFINFIYLDSYFIKAVIQNTCMAWRL